MSGEFDDGKDAGALRTIGEVGEALGIKPHVLRYWEQQFPMLDPLKRSGGRRYYRSDDIALVREIDRLVNAQGYTIKGAVALLKSGPARSDLPDELETEGEAEAVGALSTKQPEVNNEAPPCEPLPIARGRSVSPDIVARLREIRSALAAAIAA